VKVHVLREILCGTDLGVLRERILRLHCCFEQHLLVRRQCGLVKVELERKRKGGKGKGRGGGSERAFLSFIAIFFTTTAVLNLGSKYSNTFKCIDLSSFKRPIDLSSGRIFNTAGEGWTTMLVESPQLPLTFILTTEAYERKSPTPASGVRPLRREFPILCIICVWYEKV
jgi:hypothetical protein